MRGRGVLKALVLGCLIAALTWPALAQASGVKVKVIVENASIRVKPSMDSEVVEENITLGTVFAVEQKTGEWYEVKYQSALGVVITGYIHEMYVEILAEEKPEEKPEAKPEEKVEEKPAEPPAGAEVPPPVEMIRPAGAGPRVELGLGFGFASGSWLTGSSSFTYQWGPVVVLNSVRETGEISHKVKNPMGLGFSLCYYAMGGFGIKVRVDYNFKQELVDPLSTYTFNWQWSDGRSASRDREWEANGDLSVMPLSFNLQYKFIRQGVFQPYVSAGVSYIMGKFDAATTTGYAFTFIIWPYQYIDYVGVPLEIKDKSLNSVGFNVGAGTDIFFTPNVGLNLDVIYIIGKEHSFDWDAVPGRYRSIINGVSADFSQDELAIIEEHINQVKVNTSFFKVLLGLKFGF